MWEPIVVRVNYGLGTLLLVAGLAYYFLGMGTDFSDEKSDAEAQMTKIVNAQRRYYLENSEYVYFTRRRDQMQEGFQALGLNLDEAQQSGFDFDAGVGDDNDELKLRALTQTSQVANGKIAPLIYEVTMVKGAQESESWL